MECSHNQLVKGNEIEDQWLDAKLNCAGIFYLWNMAETFLFTMNENSGIIFLIIIFILMILINAQFMLIRKFMYDDFIFLINKYKFFEFTASLFLVVCFLGSVLTFEQAWNITSGMLANRIIFKDNSILISGLTFGIGMIFLYQKKELLKIPIYSTLLCFFGIFVYILLVFVMYFMQRVSIFVLIFALVFYVAISIAIIRVSDLDKNTAEKDRKELDGDVYDFAYKYPQETKDGDNDGKESLATLINSENDKSKDVSINVISSKSFKEDQDSEVESVKKEEPEKEEENFDLNRGSEDSFVDETDSDVTDEEEYNEYKKNMILLLEKEMQPKDSLYTIIKKPFIDEKEIKKSGLITNYLDTCLIWLFIFTIPCNKNYFKKHLYEIPLYYVSFITFFFILIEIPLISIMVLAFIVTCFFFILRYFLKPPQKKVFESCVSLTLCWCYLSKINFFFFDTLTFIKFWSNLYVVEIMQYSGLSILFPIFVFNYILIKNGRELLAYSNILQIILFYLFYFFFWEGISSVIVKRDEFKIIDIAINKKDIAKIFLDFNFQLFIIIFSILLFIVFFWMRKFTADKTFGYCLVGIGGFYFFVQCLLSYYHITSLNLYD